MLSEYDISFAVKEYLLAHGYRLVAWNPPGAQGTFTIPNPAKDPLYRGQVGSESPDLIAYNGQEFLLVEAKDNINKSYKDIEKLNRLLADRQRKQLLFNICGYQMNAIHQPLEIDNLRIVKAVAVPHAENLNRAYERYRNLRIYSVQLIDESWNKNKFVSTINFNEIYRVRTLEI